MDSLNRGRSRLVAESAIARRADADLRTQSMPFIASPIPLKHTLLSPLIRSDSASSSPPSTASSLSPDSSSSSSPDYYGSPPSPPLSLEDQVHTAYAHDDIHTAKILLLRLKGIEVTDDDDPRIAEVQDEDFDFCFAPNGGLIMDAQDEQALKERQRIELERMAAYRRQERLRMCEMKWENEKRRMREERMAALRYREMKRQEEEQRRRRRVEEERVLLAAEERRRQQTEQDMFRRRTKPRSERKVVNYSSLRCVPSSSSPLRSSWSDDDERDGSGPSSFVYDFMTLPTRKDSHRRSNDDSIQRSRSHNDIPVSTRPSHYHHHPSASLFDDSHSIPFTDVLKSMEGALFPVTVEERRARARRKESPSPSTSRPRTQSQARRIRENELVQILLDSKEERSLPNAKGKGKAMSRPRCRSSAEVCTACKRSRSSSSSIDSLPSPVSPSSAGSRLSWLSFGSSRSVASSSSSLATTPSSSPSISPRSSWFKLVDSPPSRRASWISTTSLPRSSPPSSPVDNDESCQCSQKSLIPIDIADTPLTFPLVASKSSTYAAYTTPPNPRRRTVSMPEAGTHATKDLVQVLSSTVSHSVLQVVELVHGFQQAYVTATMFSVAANVDGWEERKFIYEEKEGGVRVVRACNERKEEHRLTSNGPSGVPKPQGYRVSSKDVAVFLAVDQEEPEKRTDVADSFKDLEAPDVVRNTPSTPPSTYIDIPMSSPYGSALQPPRNTVLPNPLPYKLFFKPIPPPTRSPFRFNAFSHLHTTYPDQDTKAVNEYWPSPESDVQPPTWRIRSVGNPVYLRLRALQNVIWQKGVVWEGRGREMGLGGGRDRVVGVAYEGVGGSHLSRR